MVFSLVQALPSQEQGSTFSSASPSTTRSSSSVRRRQWSAPGQPGSILGSMHSARSMRSRPQSRPSRALCMRAASACLRSPPLRIAW